MKIFRTIREMQKFSRQQQRMGKTIGMVPTMGYLHEGHLSLIDAAKNHADIVIVTIFVNPTQFAPNEDLASYPRDFKRDSQLCETSGVVAIFAPETEEMYADNCTTWVNENELSKGLCGKSRPEHFRGVTTIVAKLFNAVLPDVAVFGQKDAQQAAIICRMVRDLNFPIKIIVSPLIREPDGLAMSSRNRYLSETERQQAPVIFQVLQAAKIDIEQHGLPNNPESVVNSIRTAIEASGGKIDYIQIMDNETLKPISATTTEILIAVAVFFGKTRLLDNILIR
ncbi:MAG: pantoate--beta-alanine ligase [Victivallaceae bacterium]|nr:pantoate--beta-alanine ligase [Victivallaceae bacterium]